LRCQGCRHWWRQLHGQRLSLRCGWRLSVRCGWWQRCRLRLSRGPRLRCRLLIRRHLGQRLRQRGGLRLRRRMRLRRSLGVRRSLRLHCRVRLSCRMRRGLRLRHRIRLLKLRHLGQRLRQRCGLRLRLRVVYLHAVVLLRCCPWRLKSVRRLVTVPPELHRTLAQVEGARQPAQAGGGRLGPEVNDRRVKAWQAQLIGRSP
jgi:hypothetical protein